MLNDHRHFHLRVQPTLDALSTALTLEAHQVLTRGFVYNGVFWLNDSFATTYDRFWEYAVCIPVDRTTIGQAGAVRFHQVESVTTNWGTDGLFDFYLDNLTKTARQRPILTTVTLIIDYQPMADCSLCWG